jgi:1-acyl-sn-glycerol-3-phosphate acyltransferase
MRLVRVWLPVLLIVLWMLLLYGIRLTFYPLSRFDEPRDRRWRRWWYRLWARGFLRLAGVRVIVEGTPPPFPFYLVSNHLSYLDVFTLSALLGCGFVARGDMARWPLIGSICKSLYVLFIDRSSQRDAVRVNDLIAHSLKMGDGIVVFPESRISRGLAVEPFKSALIQPALELGLPVYYATITYQTAPGKPPANVLAGWWRPEPLFYHFRRLLWHRGLTVRVAFGPAPISGSDRKEVAHQLHAAVQAQFRPVA